MKMYVALTDYNWYSVLKQEKCNEVNFWKPGGQKYFKAIGTNEIFLFKLHSPRNYIVGGGFFVKYSVLPTFLAWDAFGIKNGAYSLQALKDSVNKYKSKKNIHDNNQNIGCIILTQPFFLEESDWIPIPKDWTSNIVQGKTYDTLTITGMKLYEQVNERLKVQHLYGNNDLVCETPNNKYGRPQIVNPRLGQGAFRVVVTDAYHRICSVTGEKTLPVLDAAHIKPFSKNGPNISRNGILLRTDIHKLFDDGYITINEDYVIEVSKRLNEDYGNGKMYYSYHGQKLKNLPDRQIDLPSKEYLRWHNENIYLG